MPNTSTPTIITQKKSKPMTIGELKTAVMERHGIQNPTSLEGSTREQLMKALTKPPIVKETSGDKKRKITSKKAGGKVEYKKHGGKVIKTNMSGDDVVRGCYD